MQQETVILNIFGDSPRVRVLDFFITFYHSEFTLEQIIKNCAVSKKDILHFWNELQSQQIIMKSRKIAGDYYFRLNIQNPNVKRLLSLEWQFVREQRIAPLRIRDRYI